MENILISKDRQAHILGVAKFLKQYAIKEQMKEQEIEDLFTLGLLHDIGYEFLDEKDFSKHNFVGGLILKRQKYKYWREIYYHGVTNCKYKSKFLDLLNWADMKIDSKGNIVSFEERLNDVSKRYNTPIEKLSCYPLVCELKQKGYKWRPSCKC